MLVLHLASGASLGGPPGALSHFDPAYGGLVADLKKARAVVVDLRARALTDARGSPLPSAP